MYIIMIISGLYFLGFPLVFYMLESDPIDNTKHIIFTLHTFIL